MKKKNQNGYQVFSLLLLASYALCDSAHAAPSGTKGGSKRTKDITPPSVVISSPLSGTVYTTAQSVLISAQATDDIGVSRVEFYRNNVLICSDVSSPFSCSWSISSSNNGNHSWVAKAFDAAGNSASSSAVSLTVNIAPPADTQAPSVSITSPLTGTNYTTAQTVSVSASASDNVGVSKVEFYLDGVLKSTVSSSPYSYSLSITSALNGSHSLSAKAYDAANNVGTSSAVSISVNIPLADTQAPSIPSGLQAQAVSSSQINLSWLASTDNVGVSGYKVYRCQGAGCIPNALLATLSAGSTSYSNSGLPASTTYVYAVSAFDAASNQSGISSAASATTQAAPDTQAPSVSITSPLSGASYTTEQTVSVSASASDNVGVSKMEFYLDGVLKSTVASAPYSYSLSITSTLNGTHSLSAKAYDAAGNSATSASVNLTVNIATYGAHLWSLQFGGPTTADVAAGQQTAFDPWGNVFVTAFVRGAVDFGSGALSSNGGNVLAKYDANGNILWSRLWTRQQSAEFYVRGLGVQSDGSVVVTGYFYGTIDFGGSTLTSVGGYDMYLVKYSSNGQYQWSQRFGATGSEVPNALAVDGSGNLFVTGYIQGSADLGGGAKNSNSGSRDVFLAKYSPSGAHLWSKTFGDTSTDEGVGVAVDNGGNAWMTGSFQGTMNLGDQSWVSAGMTDIFVAGFTTDGAIIKSWREGGAGRDSGRAIAFDGLGNLVLGVHFEGSVSFGGTQGMSSAGYVDIALLQYSPIGSLQWGRKIGGNWNDAIYGLAVNASGEIAVTGTFNSWIDISGASYFADGSVNVYIAKFNRSGERLWARIGGLDWDDYGNGIALDQSGSVVATGSFSKAIDLGGGLLSTVVNSNDGYLVRYAP